MAPQFANGGHGGEVVLGILGIVVVLVAGSGSVVQPVLHAFFNGPVGVGLDGFLKSLGMAPQFANNGHGGEVILGMIGIIIVLVAGSIWRKRKLQGAEHSATA